jgi:hypothetical protein
MVVQLLLNERGEVKVVFLKPLRLVFSNCDVLLLHYVYLYTLNIHGCLVDDGGVSLPYSLPDGSLLEEGGLPPAYG